MTLSTHISFSPVYRLFRGSIADFFNFKGDSPGGVFRRISIVGFLALTFGVFSAASVFAEANYVYHEQTANAVANPDRDATPACSANAAKGTYVQNTDRAGTAGYQIYSTESYTLRFKVEFQFFTNEARVLYTTDGTAPSATFSGGALTPTGTTQQVTASYANTYRDCGLADQVVDIVTATIPAQPAGTTVRYIVASWHNGGGNIVYGNSAGAPCTGCGFYCSVSTCATNFQYGVVAPPTAAGVTIAGRVQDADGRGIANASVIMTAPSGEQRVAISSPFGFYRFDEVSGGVTYVFSILHKRYQFQSQAFDASDSIYELNFTAQP
ncbi:MAG: carboxypeptidase-like regulatory domain-containing protein [Acidobacteriota bacterium]|nr:carboxypeptidase-like regulatory domain-containing protein [Acidobacteriota bacterium]